MMDFLTELKDRNSLLCYFGWACFVSALICIVLASVTKTQVLGISAWIKPMKFFLSSGIFAWTMGWLLYYLPDQNKVTVFSWVVIAVLAFETLYISIQAGRGMMSHFNTASAFYSFMFNLMGIAITVMTVWTGYMGWLFFMHSFPELPVSYLWGIRFGIAFFVLFALGGYSMVAMMKHTVGAADGGRGIAVLNWSRTNGDLRVAHFFGMHALQLLPLFGWYISRKTGAVHMMSAVYFLFVVFTLVRAYLGRPFV